MPKAVLVIDDNEAIRRVLCELFESQADFGICGEAENGKEAIDRAWELCPDLIVLDLSMPVMNGLNAACVLKRAEIMEKLLVEDDKLYIAWYEVPKPRTGFVLKPRGKFDHTKTGVGAWLAPGRAARHYSVAHRHGVLA